MAVYRRPARQRFVLLVLTLLSVTIITLDQRGQGASVIEGVRSGVRDAFAPVQSVANAIASPISGFFGGAFRYRHLQNENARLRRELATARTRSLQVGSIEGELKSLTALQHLPFVGNIPSVTARVVATSPSNFELTVVLDKGTGAGIRKDMPVVAQEGLVGRVVQVSGRRAVVLLLTDPSFNVGVRLSRSGDVGVAKGDGAGHALSVDLVDPSTKVGHREVVVTSGLQESVFPPGIPVGVVRNARLRAGALQQDVSIDPVVDVRRVSFVKVLQWTGSS